MALEPYQERVVAEKAELDERRAKLVAFLASPAVGVITMPEQERLHQQAVTMGVYSDILRERIEAWG